LGEHSILEEHTADEKRFEEICNCAVTATAPPEGLKGKESVGASTPTDSYSIF